MFKTSGRSKHRCNKKSKRTRVRSGAEDVTDVLQTHGKTLQRKCFLEMESTSGDNARGLWK